MACLLVHCSQCGRDGHNVRRHKRPKNYKTLLVAQRARHDKTYKAKKIAAGQCTRCGIDCKPFRMCLICRVKMSQYKQKWRAYKKAYESME